jgi:hypothetical protein
VHPFAEFLDSRIAKIEAPPFSPFLTKPLTIFLVGVGLYQLWWRPSLPRQAAAILRLALVAHSSAVLLILAAIYLTMRYWFDFAPFMTVAALIGHSSDVVDGGGKAGELAQAAEHRGGEFVHAWDFRQPLRPFDPQVWSIAVPMPVRLALLPFAPFARAAFEP